MVYSISVIGISVSGSECDLFIRWRQWAVFLSTNCGTFSQAIPEIEVHAKAKSHKNRRKNRAFIAIYRKDKLRAALFSDYLQNASSQKEEGKDKNNQYWPSGRTLIMPPARPAMHIDTTFQQL